MKTIIAPLLFALATTAVAAGCQMDAGEAQPITAVAAEDVTTPRFDVTANLAADEQLHLLTRIYLDTGGVFEFYEPSPGQLMVSEAGPAGVPTVHQNTDFTGMTVLDIHEQLAPGQPIPRRLRDAHRRAVERENGRSEPVAYDREPGAGGLVSEIRSSADASRSYADAGEGGFAAGAGESAAKGPGADESSEQGLKAGSCSRNWFSNQFCSGSGGDYSWCLTDHWNGAYAWCNNLYFFETTVCADIGNIGLQVNAGDGDGGLWVVNQGTYRWYQKVCGSTIFDWCDEYNMRTDIVWASNNRFHFAGDCIFD